jgi:hypothetical protein
MLSHCRRGSGGGSSAAVSVYDNDLKHKREHDMTYGSGNLLTGPAMRLGWITRFAKGMVVTALVFGLVAINVLTLIDAKFHSFAYGVMVSTVKALGLGDTVLAKSPTVVKEREIESATQNLQAEVSRLKVSVAELSVVNAALKVSVAALSVANTALLADKKMLTEWRDRSKNTVSRIANKIRARSARNAAINVAELLPASIPIAGIPVNILLTSMDVNDACSTMKDLNDMNQEFELDKEDVTRVCGLRVPSADEVKKWVKDKLPF